MKEGRKEGRKEGMKEGRNDKCENIMIMNINECKKWTQTQTNTLCETNKWTNLEGIYNNKNSSKKKADENTFILNCGKSNTITTRKFQKPCINQWKTSSSESSKQTKNDENETFPLAAKCVIKLMMHYYVFMISYAWFQVVNV